MKIHNIQDLIVPKNSSTIVFVTGCTGQDGSLMVDYLLRTQPNSFVVGGARRLSVDNHENVKHLEHEPRFQMVNFDLTDSHSIYKLVEKIKPHYFINFAAQSFVASSWDFARQTWQTNSTGVLDCLEAIRHSCPNCRFYNAGSSEEFGNVVYDPQDEQHPLRPRSPYGASKAAARQLMKVYRESHGIYTVQGWLFNHEGIRRGKQFVTRKISNGVAEIQKAIDSHVKGDGTTSKNFTVQPIELGNLDAKRDWSDAEDMMDAVWRMLNQDVYNSNLKINVNPVTHGCLSSMTYNDVVREKVVPAIKDYVTASGENHTIREFVEEAFKVVGIKGNWVGNGLDEKFEASFNIDGVSQVYCLIQINPKFYRPAEVEVLRGNSNAIQTELGWKPKTTFKELVKKMVKWDLSQS
jgi:GDPmannose 4,6-dehydratase